MMIEHDPSKGINDLLEDLEHMLDAMNTEKSLEKQMALYTKALDLHKTIAQKMQTLNAQREAIEQDPEIPEGTPVDSKSIDACMSTLEKISKRFDQHPNMPLEEALSLYERSLVLGKQATTALERMSLQVNVLSKGVDGFHLEKRQANAEKIEQDVPKKPQDDRDFPF